MLGTTKLTWISAPYAELMRLSWPICVSMLSYSAMTLADTIFVGRLGKASLAGMGLAGTLAFAAVVFGIGLLRGVKVVVSQAVGAGKEDRVEQYAASGILIALAMGLLVLIFGQLLVLAVPFLAASSEASAIGADYLFVRLLGSPMLFLFCTTRETTYGMGNTRFPMIASLVANIVNIGLDYVFIVELGAGPSGAAWATVIASVLEVGILVALTNAPGFRHLKSGVHYLRAVLKMGIPTGIQFAIEVGAFTLLTVLIASMSEAEMAAHQIALSVLHFAFLPYVAISEAASVMVGQAVGANRDDLVPQVARSALLTALGYALLCTLFFVLGANWIANGFGVDSDVKEIATNLLYLAAVFQMGDACNVIGRGVLRGTGDVQWSAKVCVGIAWLFQPTLTWYFGYHLEMGAFGGWLAIVVEIFLGAIALWWRLSVGGWKPLARASREALESSSIAV